jgi:hypothetical protein
MTDTLFMLWSEAVSSWSFLIKRNFTTAHPIILVIEDIIKYFALIFKDKMI